MSLLDLECGDDISSENESGEESENSEDLKMFDDKTDTKGVEHQKVYDVKDRQLQENADDKDAAAYLQHTDCSGCTQSFGPSAGLSLHSNYSD